jgi:hypothetical protein
LSYAEDFNKYERLIADATTRDAGKQVLNMGSGDIGYAPGILVPSGSWDV